MPYHEPKSNKTESGHKEMKEGKPKEKVSGTCRTRGGIFNETTLKGNPHLVEYYYDNLRRM